MFEMEHPWNKGIQVCRNAVPGVSGNLVLYKFFSEKLRQSFSHEPIARMHFKFAWRLLGRMAQPPECKK